MAEKEREKKRRKEKEKEKQRRSPWRRIGRAHWAAKNKSPFRDLKQKNHASNHEASSYRQGGFSD